MKIIKPMTLGALTRSYQFGGERRFVVSALGFFPLAAQVQRFLAENEQWPGVVKALAAPGMPQPLDEVLAKPRAELLVTGSAYAPQGRPAQRMQVTLRAAGVTKTLDVIGARDWRYAPWLRIDEPQPFLSMPLGYAQAFGGAGHAGNPLGQGYHRNRCAALFGVNRGGMPNLERPGEPVTRHWVRYAPANFGPVAFEWQPRIGHAGRYGRKWRVSEAPGFSSSASRELFQRAPADQRLAGYLQGGEPYSLTNMHPQHATIEGQVPALRARGFIRRREAAGIEEVALAFDTVWFFPDLMLGVALYHGETVHQDPLSLDIEGVMVAYEALSMPRSFDHYAQVYAWRADPAQAAAHLFNESELAADYDAATLATRQQAAAGRQRAADETLAARRAARIADFCESTGVDPATLEAQPQPAHPPLPVPDRASIAESDFDLTAMLAGAQTLAAHARAEADRLRAQLPEPPAAPAPASDTQARREAALARAAAAADDLMPASADLVAAQAHAGDAQGAQQAKATAAAAKRPAQLRAARRATMRYTDPDGPLPRAAARWLGTQIEQWHRAGVVLAGRDLAGIDLSGFDLSGADLREVQLENADLRGTRFAGAQLDRAVLTGARLDGADFSGASLVEANLSHSNGRATRLAGANLTRAWAFNALWADADLSDARLDDFTAPEIELAGARLERVAAARMLLLNARAPGSHWSGAQLEAVVLLRAQLTGADFRAAALRKVVLMDAVLENSRFTDATLVDVAAGGQHADWSHALCTGMRAQHCSWHQATLTASDWRGARAAQCDFGRSDLSLAVLDDASFAGCLLTAAKLNGARAERTDLFRAVCRSADFSDAVLRDASLYQADTSDARFAGADLSGVVIEAGRKAVA